MNPAENYIIKQPEPYRSILMHVKAIIEYTLPDCELKYKWRIPCFYNGKTAICYLNQSKDYVDVGFWYSNGIENYKEFLVTENRKVVKSLRYKSLEDINETILTAIINEVYTNKEQGFYKKNK